MSQPPEDKKPTLGDKLSLIFVALIFLLAVLGGVAGLIRDGWDTMSKESPGILVALLLIGMLVYIGVASYMKEKGKNRTAATMYGVLVLVFLFVFIGQFSTCSTNLPEEVDRPYRY